MKAQSSQFYRMLLSNQTVRLSRAIVFILTGAGDVGDATAVLGLTKQCLTCMLVINEAHVTLSMAPVIACRLEAMFPKYTLIGV